MKSIAPLLSHIMFVALGIIVAVMILITVSNVKVDIQTTSTQAQLDYASEYVANEILGMYSMSKESNSLPFLKDATILSEMKLQLPDKISDKKYMITLSKNEVSVKLSDLESKKLLNTDIFMSGSSYLPASLILKRYSNGTDWIEIKAIS